VRGKWFEVNDLNHSAMDASSIKSKSNLSIRNECVYEIFLMITFDVDKYLQYTYILHILRYLKIGLEA
jgi:hypothetical protein